MWVAGLYGRVIVILNKYRTAKSVAEAAHLHDTNTAKVSWATWLQEGPAKGLGRQHMMSRVASGWIPSRECKASDPIFDSRDDDEQLHIINDVEGVTEEDVEAASQLTWVPLNSQQAVDVAASEWAEVWQEGKEGQNPRWPAKMGSSLPAAAVGQLREACFTFAPEVGLGWDKTHPRALARCSDEVLDALIKLFVLCETLGIWPKAIGVIIVVLIPKADGGRRPIGLFPNFVRLWMRIRLPLAQAWIAENEHPFFYAGPCKGADVAAWKQSLLAESAHTLHLPYACTLLDLIKAFDSVPFDVLAACAEELGYNLFLMRLTIAAYKLARVLEVDGCCSAFVFATRGLGAGSVLAVIELRVLLLCDDLGITTYLLSNNNIYNYTSGAA